MVTLPRDAFRDVSAYQAGVSQEFVGGTEGGGRLSSPQIVSCVRVAFCAIRRGPFCLLVCVIVLSPVVSRSFQFCVVGLSAFTGSFANRLLRKLVVNLSLCEKGVSNVVRELKPSPSPAGNSKWSSFYKDLYTGPFGVHRLNPWQG
ncbi:unnamed protein product [Sphagnum jensenii]|uniref:Uncharacterized protein n=1 Tax=Sphagnum jensenii TaxID=128206 RepID=A0ABP1AZA5_9BRYO